MREIKNNVEITKINKVDNKTKTQETPKPSFEGDKTIKDFSNSAMESLGRSQVKSAKTDNIENDLAALIDDPKKVENAEKFFDIAFEKLQKSGDPNAFETAALLTGIYSQEVLGLNAKK